MGAEFHKPYGYESISVVNSSYSVKQKSSSSFALSANGATRKVKTRQGLNEINPKQEKS